MLTEKDKEYIQKLSQTESTLEEIKKYQDSYRYIYTKRGKSDITLKKDNRVLYTIILLCSVLGHYLLLEGSVLGNSLPFFVSSVLLLFILPLYLFFKGYFSVSFYTAFPVLVFKVAFILNANYALYPVNDERMFIINTIFYFAYAFFISDSILEWQKEALIKRGYIIKNKIDFAD